MLALRQSSFEGHVDTDFQLVEHSSAVCGLRLTQIVEHIKTPTQENFSLMFVGPANPFVPQGMRMLVHKELGELELFLVPVGQVQDGFQYEAVFNLLLPTS
jgi:hypothetical protein